MKIRDCLITCIALVASGQLYAQSPEPWWFDIEVIVFKRALDAPPVENFEGVEDLPKNYAYDLVSEILKPNITGVVRAFPLCPVPEALPSVDEIIAQYELWQTHLSELNDAAKQASSSDGEDALNTIDQQVVIADRTNTVPQETSNLRQQETEQVTDLLATTTLDSETENAIFTDNEFPAEDSQSMLTQRLQALIDNAAELPEISVSARFDCLSEQDIQRVDQTFYLVDSELPELKRIPKRIDGNNWFLPQSPHILPTAEHQLSNFANQIERLRGHQILHHTVWRQEVVFGRDVAPSMRLVAGENFMASFIDAKATEQSDIDNSVGIASNDTDAGTEQEEDFFRQLNTALALDQPIDVNALLATVEQPDENIINSNSPEWELDGEFKVFLKYINRVPYLHIDSKLVFQQLDAIQDNSQAPVLQRIPFEQLRRVISKQIHYFDHPLFGLVVQIRRHQRPDPDDSPKFLGTELNTTAN